MNQLFGSGNRLDEKLGWVKLSDMAIGSTRVSVMLYLVLAAWFGPFRRALGPTFLVLGECLVPALERGRCPLTDIFGLCFFAGDVVLPWRWIARPQP